MIRKKRTLGRGRYGDEGDMSCTVLLLFGTFAAEFFQKNVIKKSEKKEAKEEATDM